MSAFTDELERLVRWKIREDTEEYIDCIDLADRARRRLEDLAEKLFKLLTEED